MSAPAASNALELSETIVMEGRNFTVRLVTTQRSHDQPRRQRMRMKGPDGGVDFDGILDAGELHTVVDVRHTLTLAAGPDTVQVQLTRRDLDALRRVLAKAGWVDGDGAGSAAHYYP